MNVVFIVFNRPLMTKQVFGVIAQVKPERLFVIADGPRPTRPGDAEKVKAVREIVDRIDWPCEVFRNYSEVNLGCMRRVESGLDWVFSKVEEAIILEDDCLPHPDFFRFCSEMLELYRNDQRVGHIGGTNFHPSATKTVDSYSFSIYAAIWGWATWRRAWRDYDSKLRLWPKLRAERRHYDMFPSLDEARYFERLWDDLYAGTLNAWGGRWLFARLINGTVSVRPSVNMVSNIGFGEVADATHTTSTHEVGFRPVSGMTFPLTHPACLIVDRSADHQHAAVFFRLVNPVWPYIRGRLFNRYWYGKMLRRMPGLGKLWGRWRSTRDPSRTV